jgi:hypothetical protein
MEWVRFMNQFLDYHLAVASPNPYPIDFKGVIQDFKGEVYD